MNHRYKSKSFWFFNFPISLGIFLFLFFEIYLVQDLYSFELHHSFELFGLSGLLIFLWINIFSIYLLFTLISPKNKDKIAKSNIKKHSIFIVPTALLFLWILDWVFIENPISNRIFAGENKAIRSDNLIKNEDLNSFSLYKVASQESKDKIKIMYARIQANRYDRYQPLGFASKIDQLSTQYQIKPELLFYWLYMGSFWGEAVSAKMPFFKDMTAETFRDYVQIHLPYWFIESPLRVYLVESNLLENIFGSNFGKKLRYAFQKANYDISAEPYDVYIYTDIYIVLKKYRSEFPEIFENNSENKLNIAIADSITHLESNFSFTPCSPIYHQDSYSESFYNENRRHLIAFARSVFYKLMFDMDFATKIQALVAKNIDSNYEKALGKANWEKVSPDQKLAFIAMLRDVYRPNIGKVSHNLYNLPEFNCAPINFVIDSIKDNNNFNFNLDGNIWLPENHEYLWAGATKKLQILSEVLEITRGKPLQGIRPSKTIEQVKEKI
jgi:hypothetical protein